jgi:hypothetical protein
MAFLNDAGFEDDFRKVGNDATAGFEPADSPSNPTEHASSENLEVAGKTDDLDDEDEEEDDDLEDEDDLEDDDEEDEDDEEDDLEDDDEDLDDDEDDDEELEDDEEDDDVDEEDDEDELDEDDDTVKARNSGAAAVARRR